MTHGGKRAGAGRPPTNIDHKRIMVLRAQGLTCRVIAERFGVPYGVIVYAVKKAKRSV